jgi:hypothetical protein
MSRDDIGEWAASQGWRYKRYQTAPASRRVKVTEVFPDLLMAHYSVGRYTDSFMVDSLLSGSIGATVFTAVEAVFVRASGTICAVSLPGSMPQFDVTRRALGAEKVKTGYEPFDRRFRVRCDDPDFVAAVFTPDLTAWLAGLDKSDHLVRCGVNIVHRSAFMCLNTQYDLKQVPAMVVSLANFVGHLPAQAWTWNLR